MLRLYGTSGSGNCYKCQLILALTGQDYEWIEIDILKGLTRQKDFLAKNPNGRVPTLELPDGQYLPESNAILHYLAEGSEFLPRERLQHAQVLQWMFFEQYSHEPFIATSRYWLHFLRQPETYKEKLAEKQPGGYAALGVMEQHLARHDWLVGGRYSIADIALYAYTHVADEGGFDLAGFPAVRAWLARVAAHPRHVKM